MKDKTGLTVLYVPLQDGGATLQVVGDSGAPVEAKFSKSRIDEAHILYMEATELLRSRGKMGEDPASIRETVEKLFALFRGEKVSFPPPPMAPRAPSAEFIPNPGKEIVIDVDGVKYQRLPVRTRLITMKDSDIQPLLDDYVKPYLKPDDVLYISEKALTITQGRIVDMSTFHPSWLAHLFARNVGNNYGSNDFKGFGHARFCDHATFWHSRNVLSHLRLASEIDRLPNVVSYSRICALGEARAK